MDEAQFFLPFSASLHNSVNILQFNLSCDILLSLSQNLILNNFVIIEIGTHPISPSNVTVGAFLPTPRKLIRKF